MFTKFLGYLRRFYGADVFVVNVNINKRRKAELMVQENFMKSQHFHKAYLQFMCPWASFLAIKSAWYRTPWATECFVLPRMWQFNWVRMEFRFKLMQKPLFFRGSAEKSHACNIKFIYTEWFLKAPFLNILTVDFLWDLPCIKVICVGIIPCKLVQVTQNDVCF